MRLLSVNIGDRRPQSKGNEVEITGIYKIPAHGAVNLTRLGIKGDFIGDPKDHGGPDQAVYVYGAADYEWWSRELGRPLGPGAFGENLTISELESARFLIGDRLHVGSAILEVTAPRIPCSTLARRMGDPLFVKKYRRAERPGMHCRVIQEGMVQAGDTVASAPYAGETIMLLDIFREHYERDKRTETLQRFLRARISARTRAYVQKHLHRLLANE